ncbi:MAG: HD domain-containing protein [Clostridium sp.]|jgi:predicted HD superfamily hydrolase involved in NAD metabolism|nr:HD domain-containing protein [Clostridium sp.]
MTVQEMKKKLEETLSSKRFKHSVRVMDTAVELAKKYREDKEKAAIAGILHDCARHIEGQEVFELCKRYGIEVNYITGLQPQLLHGPLGAALAKDVYGVEDEDVTEAIGCHTTGRENMTLLDKIIFIADYIEPGRKFYGVDEVRELAYKDLDKAVLLSLENTIRHILNKGVLIHPNTINARNYIIKESMK